MPLNKKRKKSSRFRGTHTHGRGFKKKARGSGHRGGVGMAGSGKRGDQKKTLVTKEYGNKYFGKDKVSRKKKALRIKTVSLSSVQNNLESFVKKGLAKLENGSYIIELQKYKIIGNSGLEDKVVIKAHSASNGALETVKKKGGEIILVSKKE